MVGSDVKIVSSAKFSLTGKLSVGSGTWIGHDVLILGGAADVTIGKNVDIGPRVTLVTGTHELFSSREKAAGPGYSLPIIIGDGSWIGASSTILGGAVIGKRALVAAGALVNGEVLSESVVGGVPAKPLSESKQCRVE